MKIENHMQNIPTKLPIELEEVEEESKDIDVPYDTTPDAIEEEESPIDGLPPLYDTSISIVKEATDFSTTYDYINKKRIDLFNEKINIKDLKYSQGFYFDIESQVKNIFVKNCLSKFGNILLLRDYELLIQNDDIIYLIRLETGTYMDIQVKNIFLSVFSNSIEKVFTGYDLFKKHISKFICKTNIESCSLTWYTLIGNRTKYYNIIEYLNDKFFFESYPYMNGEKFINDYLESIEPVLILIGPPGTGKTKLIRQILKEACNKKIKKRVRCLFTSSKEIIEQGQIYLDLVFTDDVDFLVLEDIDYHLKPRNSGNHSLYNLLSVSSGLISSCMESKKIILSTNLPNIKDIDDALLRPGRCFSVLNTKKLSKEEASVVAKLIGKDKLPEKKDYSLAEIYNY